jgi:predicted double-glycine peptidase
LAAALVLFPVMLLADGAWLDVPYVRQTAEGCGPAAVAMVMQYWVRHDPRVDAAAADERAVLKALPPLRRGVFGDSMRSYLASHGFDAFVFRGTVDDLTHHIAKGRPVVVCLAPSGSGGQLHYVVVAGLDADEVLINDSARGKLFRQELAHFRTMWDQTGNWALLAVPSASRR